jgi:S1-C subfamily serine protease
MNMKLDHQQSLASCQLCWLLVAALAAGFFHEPLAAAEFDLRRDAVVVAVEQVMPSVVNIATATIVEYEDDYQKLLREFFNWGPTPPRERLNSIGSGVIIDEEGYVLTNLHVLRRASRVQVKLADGRIYDAEPVVATTHSDVALLKLKSQPGEKFKAIRFAKDDDLLLGETVLALGNPYGLGASISRGILSSKNRRPSAGGEQLDIADWLQTDAAINPGNSGGPLIDLRGELIGLNVAVYRAGQGIGFAIPVKQVSAALSDFFTPEVTDSLWFGARIKAGSVPPVVSSVQPGSPAEAAGLQNGQLVLQVNGKTPKGLVDFNRLVVGNPNHNVTLLIQQLGEQRTLKARLIPFDELIRQKVGLVLLNLTPETAASLRVKTGAGLFIDEVEKDGPADRAQLQRGYLLTEIAGQETGDLITVANILSTMKKGDRVPLTVVVPHRINNSYVEYRQGTVNVQMR